MSKKSEKDFSRGLPARREEIIVLPLDGETLLLQGERSLLLVAKAASRFVLCIETPDDEYCQAVDADDLVAISMPEGGPIEQAEMMLELVRRYHIPLVVLPKDHPGSKRLSMVVSVGPQIHLSCSIQRGTHPEQHLLCSSEEFSGVSLTGIPGGVVIKNLPSSVELVRLDAKKSAENKQQ
ncbi:alpha/beta hydrolase [Methanoculleus sp.]|jgi:hypothetical protein|uniref:alpha/beta hydrolase n=1 Tax=Methanoculleus sp. TaxID=90427 RepID=UPI0026241431|nr:alpha/beta hydrolase [Methanoculleus sp.]MDI6867035.1 alpha/beta hydrolase [Methanoculleus sp.]